MKKILLLVIGIASLMLFSGCQSCTRELKSFNADTRGLNRTAVLMNNQGDTIKVWEGELLINSDSGSSIYFDYNGKRVLISGGIFVSEEK